METKFTPGPWEVDGYDLSSVIHNERPGEPFPAWKHIVKCDYGYTKPEENVKENKANAALIAQAPSMFMQLENVISYLESFKPEWKEGEESLYYTIQSILIKATTF